MDFLKLGKIGPVDRTIRAVAGVALIAVAILFLTGVWQLVSWVVGGILLVEGVLGFCPMTYLKKRAALKQGN